MPGYHQFAYAPLAETPLSRMLSQFVGVREEIAVARVEKPKRLIWLVILLTEAGEAISESGLQRVPQRAGSMVIMPQGVIHNDRIINVPWRTRYILMTGPVADRFQSQFWQSGRRQTELYDDPPPAWRRLIVDLVELLIGQPRGWSWRALARLGILLDALLQQPPRRYSYGDLLDRVQRLIEADTGNPWRLDDIASALHTDTKTLTRQFRRLVNEPPGLWIRRLRMQLAFKFLCQGMSVTAVAEQMGFSDPFCFSRQFKTIMGVAPSSVQTRPPSRYRR